MKHVVDPIYAYILDTPLLIDSLEYLLKHRLAQDAKIGTSADEVSFAVSANDQGNTYVTGFTQGVLYGDFSAGGLDAFLIRFGSQGRELWRRQFGSIGDETGVAITTDEEGSVYLTGQTDGNLGEFTNEGGKDLFVAKDDSLGSQQWLTQWGTVGDDLGIKIWMYLVA